jgi:hypothetical protein
VSARMKWRAYSRPVRFVPWSRRKEKSAANSSLYGYCESALDGIRVARDCIGTALTVRRGASKTNHINPLRDIPNLWPRPVVQELHKPVAANGAVTSRAMARANADSLSAKRA